jgi:ubiquinone biosynthesis protein UbiJ
MRSVLLHDEHGAGLLALILRNFLRELAGRQDPGVQKRLAALSGTVEIRADEMVASIVFSEGIEVRYGPAAGRADTVLYGRLSALVEFLAHKRFVASLLSGRLGFRGSMWLALRLLRLFLRA